MKEQEDLDKKDGRKPRADALRNRDRLLEAARSGYSPARPEASLEAVARTAGVEIAGFTVLFRRARRCSRAFTAARSSNWPILPNG